MTLKPVALVTGVSRSAGIGAAIVGDLARAGWDIAMTYWPAYDDRMPWRSNSADFIAIEKSLQADGARTVAVAVDLAQPDVISSVFDAVEQHLAPATALVRLHCESVHLLFERPRSRASTHTCQSTTVHLGS